MSTQRNNIDFQTPLDICEYMASYLPENAGIILEPTAGAGNLVSQLKIKGDVIAPDDFFELDDRKFDWIVMNPPFSPMTLGYEILYTCMEKTNNLVALMPWLTLINSEKRLSAIMNYGLVSVTHLPRNVFKGSRVQTCILHMQKGYSGDTQFIQHIRK